MRKCPLCGSSLGMMYQSSASGVLVFCSMVRCNFWFRLSTDAAIDELFRIFERGEAIT